MTATTYHPRWVTLSLNARDGGMRLRGRGFGYHGDPGQTQRVIGRHVYIFRREPGRRISVWRLESDGRSTHWWRLVHDFRRATPVQLGLAVGGAS